ncbi:MAG: hypothetical protein M3322_14035, partial [Actinomycetota bacterium]|nr:hypothetical protein [Actinomycetota bacterium]
MGSGLGGGAEQVEPVARVEEALARIRDERISDEHAQAVRKRAVVLRVQRLSALVVADTAEVTAKLAQRH